MDDKKKPGAYAGYTEARKAANARYEANTVERVSVVLPKGKKAVIQSHAAARGESVNGFIGRAITETMERDNGGVSRADTPAEAAQNALERVLSGGAVISDGTETPSEAVQNAAQGG